MTGLSTSNAPALPAFYSTHSKHLEDIDIDTKSQQTISDTEPMDIDTDNSCLYPPHNLDETLLSSGASIYLTHSATLKLSIS